MNSQFEALRIPNDVPFLRATDGSSLSTVAIRKPHMLTLSRNLKLEDGACLQTRGTITSVAFARENPLLVSIAGGKGDQEIRIWAENSESKLQQVETLTLVSKHPVMLYNISPDGC